MDDKNNPSSINTTIIQDQDRDQEHCDHDVIWKDKRRYGIYPSIIKGVCKYCGKQFMKGKMGGDKNV